MVQLENALNLINQAYSNGAELRNNIWFQNVIYLRKNNNSIQVKQKFFQFSNIAKLFFISAMIVSQSLFAFSAQAQKGAPVTSTVKNGIVQCGNDDNIKNNTLAAPTNKCTLFDLFNTGIRIINLLILVAGVFAVIRIVIAGFAMVISAGNEEQLTAGKNGLTNALLGLFIVMAAYLAINTVFSLLIPGGGTILRSPLEFISS
jgi:hypothetical protein